MSQPTKSSNSNCLLWVLVFLFVAGKIVYDLNTSFSVTAQQEEEQMKLIQIAIPTQYDSSYHCHLMERKLFWRGPMARKKFELEQHICLRDFEKLSKRYLSSSTIPYTLNEYYRYMLSQEGGFIKSMADEFYQVIYEHKLNRMEAAKMIVSFVQYIPYTLVHRRACNDYLEECKRTPKGNPLSFSCDWHLNLRPKYRRAGFDRNPCAENVRKGVHSPLQFMYTLKGDCDTRSLFLFSILKDLGFPVAILTSDIHRHAVLGFGMVPDNFSGDKVEDPTTGIEYYFWETTNRGWPLGRNPRGPHKMNEWYISLK